MKFYDVILDMNSCNIVLAQLSKEETAKVFADARKQPKNDAMEPDDTFVSGEVHYVFDKENGALDEVLIYPTYEEDDSLVNGDFIEAPESFWDKESEARQQLSM